jgi:hypothetical protein
MESPDTGGNPGQKKKGSESRKLETPPSSQIAGNPWLASVFGGFSDRCRIFFPHSIPR